MSVIALLFAITFAMAPAKAAPAEDPVGLAAILVQDGHWDRARSVLVSIDESAPGINLVRLNATRGLLALFDQDPGLAMRRFRAAREAAEQVKEPEPKTEVIALYMARAHMMAEEPAEALEALGRAGTTADESVLGWRVRTNALRKTGALSEAWTSSVAGRSRFPDAGSLVRAHVDLAVEMNLLKDAVDTTLDRVEHEDCTADEARDLALRFRAAGALEDAYHLLEAGVLRFPNDLRIRVANAALALELNKPAQGARQLQIAAEADIVYAIEAAEAYRRAGALHQALYMNRIAADGPEKLRQRLGLLLELESFEEARSLESRFARMGIEDDQIRYGLAYAHFRQGQTDRAETLLNRIQDSGVFAQSIGLREAIAECRETPCF